METELDIFSGESVNPTETPEQTKQSEQPVVAPKPIESTLFGEDLFGNHCAPAADGALKKRFLIPPFSVLNAREGVWQDRKRAWISLGIKSELGRGGMAATGGSAEPLARARAGEQSIFGKSQDVIDAERESRQLQEPRQASSIPTAAPGGSPRPACDYSKRQRGDGAGRPIT